MKKVLTDAANALNGDWSSGTTRGFAIGVLLAAASQWDERPPWNPEQHSGVILAGVSDRVDAYRDGFDYGLEQGRQLDPAGYPEGFEAGVRFMKHAEQCRATEQASEQDATEQASEQDATEFVAALAAARAEGYRQGARDARESYLPNHQDMVTDDFTGLRESVTVETRDGEPVAFELPVDGRTHENEH